MPVYEYSCDSCEIIFEHLFLNLKEAREFADHRACPECGHIAERVPSAASFSFKGVAEGDPTRSGNSGVHDLDYPSLDKAIGRSANRKWKKYHADKAQRDKARRELGTNSITTDSDGSNVRPASSDVLRLRGKGLSTLKKAERQNS